MSLILENGVSALAVFLQGILSFFSPCILPLVPLYIGYLAGGAKSTDAEGRQVYRRGKVMLHTLFFIIGISFAFFLLGFGFTTLGRFFSGNRLWFARAGGILVIFFGLYQLLGISGGFLGKERRLPFSLEKLAMNPLVALLFGFTFSFAWTPCVGPALASVLLMASSAKSSFLGFALIGVYTLGFVLPFLAVGLFTGQLLDLFRRHNKLVKYTVKAGGVLLILMGVMMMTGSMNSITGYLSGLGQNNTSQESDSDTGDGSGNGSGSADGNTDSSSNNDSGETKNEDKTKPDTADSGSPKESADKDEILAPDFTLLDQFGNEHTLSEYEGKTVFLNFWATWCSWCKKEMPDLQKLYEDYGENTGDVIILGVASPDVGDESQEIITQFLSDNGYTYPTVMDVEGTVFSAYGASSLPTTFMINSIGQVYGYVPGALSREQMDSIIKQTIEGTK